MTYRNGAPVRIQDVGRAIDSVENNRVASWFKDKRAVILGIQRQPGANVVEVVDAINELLPGLRTQIPQSINLEVFFDRTQSIRESAHDVQLTLIGTIFLVILVIFLFLRNVSATIIPSLAVPMSIVGTFAVMYLLDYSLNNLVPDGVDSGGGLRRRRRDRRPGKHRAPHGTRRKALRSRGEGRPGDRFYHHVDDDLAGGGVHTGACS